MSIKHFFLAFFCATLWGMNFPLMKMIALELPPVLSTALRLTLIGVCVLFVKRPTGEWKKIFLLSFTLFALTLGSTTVAIKEVDASIAAFLNELEVPFAALLGFFLLGEKLEKKQLFGMLLSFLGVYFIVWSPEVTYEDWWPIVLLIIAAFSYGFSAVFIKFVKKSGALTITTWSSLFAAIELYFLSYFFLESGEYASLTVPSTKVIMAIGVSAGISLMAFYLWNYLLTLYKVNQVVAFGMLLPLSSLIFSYFLLGETTHYIALFGGALTLVGVWFQS